VTTIRQTPSKRQPQNRVLVARRRDSDNVRLPLERRFNFKSNLGIRFVHLYLDTNMINLSQNILY
jgi:hypothetical protein